MNRLYNVEISQLIAIRVTYLTTASIGRELYKNKATDMASSLRSNSSPIHTIHI